MSKRLTLVCVYLLTLAIIILVAGCGAGVRSQPPIIPDPPSVADQIRSLGTTFLRYGGLVLGLGMVVRAVVWAATITTFTGFAGAAVAWILKFLAPFVGLAAVGGGAAVAFGAACVWMADYLWIVVCAGIAACVACCVYYWPRIRSWIPARKEPRK